MLTNKISSSFDSSKNKTSKSNRIIDFIILTLFILYTAGAANLTGNDSFSIGATIFLAFFFIRRKRKIDSYIIILLTLWCIINMLSIIINGSELFNLISFAGVTLRIFIAYLIVKTVGITFFEKFYKYAFKLVIISTIIYGFNILYPSFFSSLSPYLNFITKPEQRKSGGWYIFIYMLSGWNDTMRNCGFMWEPGGYACILIFLILFRLLKNQFKFDIQIFLLIIALITTYSTAGYLALFVILLFFLIQNSRNNKIYKLLLPITLLVAFLIGIRIFESTDFLKLKIYTYLEQGTESREWSFEDQYILRVSRLGIAVIELESSIFRPLGNGIIQSKYVIDKYGPVAGPNSLADILRQWGWIGIYFFVFTFSKFSKFYTKSTFFSVCFVLSISIVLFSNPFHFKYLIYGIVFYVMSYKKYIFQFLQSN